MLTQADWGGAKSQESCGLINYHLKETEAGPPEVTTFPSKCSEAVSWKVKNIKEFKSAYGDRTTVELLFHLNYKHSVILASEKSTLTFTADVFYVSCRWSQPCLSISSF